MSRRKEKINALIKEFVSKFILRDARIKNGLITVIRTDMSSDFKNLKIYITIYPEKWEEDGLKLLNKHKKRDWMKYLAENYKTKFLPKTEFLIDKGEKARISVEELLKNN